jgi:hypothetical protein
MDTTCEATNDIDRPFHDAGRADDAITTTAYTVPVRQAAELFRQAGFPYSDDHISRLCKQGVPRAAQQTTRNKLKHRVTDREGAPGSGGIGRGHGRHRFGHAGCRPWDHAGPVAGRRLPVAAPGAGGGRARPTGRAARAGSLGLPPKERNWSGGPRLEESRPSESGNVSQPEGPVD